MVPAPVAALEEVLDKMDEEILVEGDENEKIDMSIDEDEADDDTDTEADIDADDAADDAD
jgi:hypothetical protein